MAEKEVWKDFKAWIPGDTIRFETRERGGIPDLNYCLPNGSSGWVEAKFIEDFPKIFNTRVETGLRGDQALFLNRRWKVGGKAFLITRVESMNADYLTSGEFVIDLVLKGVPFIRFEHISIKCPIKEKMQNFIPYL